MNGLDDVIAAETVLSDVDGQAGTLIIRGRSLDELAGRSTLEQVLALLWDGLFDSPPSAAAVPALLGRARLWAYDRLSSLDTRELQHDPVEALRVLLAHVDDGENLDTALRLVAGGAVFTAAVLRLGQGLAPIAPDAGESHSADLLRMVHDKPPTTEQVAALDRYLVSVSDHGLNASTFAARVVASTRAGLTSAVIAALSALKGPLHGGAPGPVLDYLDSIGEPDRASDWLQEKLARGERLMGFGHRIYRVRDPRADAVKAALQSLIGARQVDARRLRLAEAVEATALDLLAARKPDRPLQTNVEFYTALLLEALGFPREAFTCVFAIGRTCGWIAHAREQVLGGRLIRPRSHYVGPRPLTRPDAGHPVALAGAGYQSSPPSTAHASCHNR